MVAVVVGVVVGVKNDADLTSNLAGLLNLFLPGLGLPGSGASMKLVTIQEHADGPWRWAILDDDGYVLGKSREVYQREGMAARVLLDIVRNKLPGLEIQTMPSVQLHLFEHHRPTMGG